MIPSRPYRARNAVERVGGQVLMQFWTVAALVGCVPHATQLTGSPAPRATSLPLLRLDAAMRAVFTWSYEEQNGPAARGDGVAQFIPPDTARLTFYLGGGFAAGSAQLAGDHLDVSDDAVRRFVPAAPLLWAALGRLSLPAGTDTAIRVSGDTLRADVAGRPTWRVLVVGDTLRRLERIEGGRVVEIVDRTGSRVTYQHLVERRSLRIDVTRSQPQGR